MTEHQQPSRRGCLFYVGVIGVAALVVVVITALVGAHYARRLVAEFTDAAPVQLPRVQLSGAQVSRLRERVESFTADLKANRPTTPLVLTADEVNALLATDTNLTSYRDHFYVSFDHGQLMAQMSIPAEQLGLDPLRGRYVNANGTFTMVLRDGRLFVNAESLSTKGRAFPQDLLRAIRLQNLGEVLNTNSQVSAVLTNLAKVEIQDDRLTLEAKNTR